MVEEQNVLPMQIIKIISFLVLVAAFASCSKENIAPNNPNADQALFSESMGMEVNNDGSVKEGNDINAKGGTDDPTGTGLGNGPLGNGSGPITDPNTDEDKKKKRTKN